MTGGGRSRRTVAAVLLAAALPLALSGCKKEAAQAGAGQPDDPSSLSILAGSELRDIEPLVPEIERAAKVKLNFQYSGTLEGTERLLNGETPDVAWFSHAKYLTLQQGLKGRVLSSEKTMLSPVVLGVKTSLARQWGWDRNSVTWKDIAAKAQSGELKYGMTNPAASNSGSRLRARCSRSPTGCCSTKRLRRSMKTWKRKSTVSSPNICPTRR